jgi:glycosyltransferase involved in cell wall biosynthesis
MTIVEAFASALPVIASNLGSMAELIEDGTTGLLFEPGNADDLARKVQWAWEHPEEMRRMGEAARREYEQKYTPERNYQMLMDIYQQAIEHRRSRSPRRSG